ncbi:hypothetical protein CEXT_97461 [Caerostris extrusa]|uniref:Uncharacterized protein n=1 Tax=Caerostris extrusa TaxID=172846 RepID=A0AAV4Y0P6_CAEEX|nr:hypothetical protein CEXT_97461 [Caerostris extrusa]
MLIIVIFMSLDATTAASSPTTSPLNAAWDHNPSDATTASPWITSSLTVLQEEEISGTKKSSPNNNNEDCCDKNEELHHTVVLENGTAFKKSMLVDDEDDEDVQLHDHRIHCSSSPRPPVGRVHPWEKGTCSHIER